MSDQLLRVNNVVRIRPRNDHGHPGMLARIMSVDMSSLPDGEPVIMGYVVWYDNGVLGKIHAGELPYFELERVGELDD